MGGGWGATKKTGMAPAGAGRCLPQGRIVAGLLGGGVDGELDSGVA
jgi:hypothetical protein